MSKEYCGYISLIGKPNVGKSSILNSILNKKISITSRKAQTTRNNILGIKTDSNKQMIFIDTPGMHIKSQKTMNKILNRSAQSIIDDSDIILYVIQRRNFDDNDKLILKKLKDSDQKVFCVINKTDQIDDKDKLLPFIEMISSNYRFDEIILISAKTNYGVDDLLSIIKKNIPENPHIYTDNLDYKKDNKRFIYSELIREKIIRKLGDELPHDTFVEVDKIDDENEITRVYATIYVNRKSQKQIVVGSDGRILKKIGKQARLEIEKQINKKVFLKTWVKVKKNWNTNSGFIQSLGVGSNYESN